MKLAFYSDDRWTGLWDHIRRAHDIADIYEIGGDPGDANPGNGWYVVESIDDVPGTTRVFFNPADSPSFPGTVELADFDHGADIYVFGHDEENNEPIACDCVVYIDTPTSQALFSFQAAGIVLHDKHRRGL